MSQTYPKMIDENTIGASILTSNGIDFISFNFTVYENANIVDNTNDSVNTYTYVCPLSKFSILNNNNGDTGVYTQVNLQFANTHVSFNRGEYVDLAGNVFDPVNVYTVIATLLGIV